MSLATEEKTKIKKTKGAIASSLHNDLAEVREHYAQASFLGLHYQGYRSHF